MRFDYIIVGAGSAGCVLANRLSSNGQNQVLLIEAGPRNKALSLRMPAAVLSNLNSTEFNWAYDGEPEPQLGGRRLKHDRGKTLGGSSSINGMVFIRGHALDFEHWLRNGCEGWGYADVLPYFKKLESYSHGGDLYRGDSGPMEIYRPDPENPLTLAFLHAGGEAGYPLTDDICGFRQEGFGLLDRSVHQGERWSTAKAYLEPVSSRANLSVLTEMQVQQVVLENQRAVGVVYKDQSGNTTTVQARREVILSAGAIGSPQLLMLSGIGSAKHLQELGIEVVQNLPGVGQNLNDHPDFVLKYKCLQPVSIWPKATGLAKTAAGLQWLLTKTGICASNHFEAVACVRSVPEVDYPDLQLTISPIAVDDKTWSPLPEHAFQIHIGLMQAYSRGEVKLRSAVASAPPRIRVNYLQDFRDRQALLEGIKIVRNLVQQNAFAGLCGAEIYPGSEAQSDAELSQCLTDKTVSQWHLSGTARMGAGKDKMAVVNQHGQVHGIEQLRVIDASIMPVVTNGNTNCPTIMLAEKLSDAILGNPPLPRIDADVWSPSRDGLS